MCVRIQSHEICWAISLFSSFNSDFINLNQNIILTRVTFCNEVVTGY